MMHRLLSVLAMVALLAGCGDDGDVATTTTTFDSATAIERYCAPLDGATTRGSEETMVMLRDVALPEVADLLDRLSRLESSAEDYEELGLFNEATCGVRFP